MFLFNVFIRKKSPRQRRREQNPSEKINNSIKLSTRLPQEIQMNYH
jgi:hypothetical protein